MLNIGNKTFMNMQEAVGWLLENNALPFQSTADYVGETEIAMSTLVNPSPAKVRVGSLIFFADSKVATVIGVTSNSFIVSAEYNDLVDDIVYVSNVAINASGHLICTLSNGDTIDAGLIKQVNNFSINASQHLIVSYNDGSTTDLGAIFSGNVAISGNLTVTGSISGSAISGDSIIENMSGYTFHAPTNTSLTADYAGVVKTGNKITFVISGSVYVASGDPNPYEAAIGGFTMPAEIYNKLIPTTINGIDFLDNRNISLFSSYTNSIDRKAYVNKQGANRMNLAVVFGSTVPTDTRYHFRYEVTFLLSTNMAS